MLHRCRETGQLPRAAAMDLARERVLEAMSYRM
jgi:hypothetical protein